eukprot:6796684-Pyramimonas_sp.AAC.1
MGPEDRHGQMRPRVMKEVLRRRLGGQPGDIEAVARSPRRLSVSAATSLRPLTAWMRCASLHSVCVSLCRISVSSDY